MTNTSQNPYQYLISNTHKVTTNLQKYIVTVPASQGLSRTAIRTPEAFPLTVLPPAGTARMKVLALTTALSLALPLAVLTSPIFFYWFELSSPASSCCRRRLAHCCPRYTLHNQHSGQPHTTHTSPVEKRSPPRIQNMLSQKKNECRRSN